MYEKHSLRIDDIFPFVVLFGYTSIDSCIIDMTMMAFLSHHFNASIGPLCLKTGPLSFSLAFMTVSDRFFLLLLTAPKAYIWL